jgi:transposase
MRRRFEVIDPNRFRGRIPLALNSPHGKRRFSGYVYSTGPGECRSRSGLGSTARVGPVAAGDNSGRIRNEAAWAHLCGVAPIPASSGKVTRYRLNRGGDRQANHALFRIAIVRASHDPRTKAYIERRLAEGRTKGEIFRCLKRYIAREVFKYLPRDLRA